MDLLTIEQVAQRLACSDDQVRVLINSGQLNYVNIGTGMYGVACVFQVTLYTNSSGPDKRLQNRQPNQNGV